MKMRIAIEYNLNRVERCLVITTTTSVLHEVPLYEKKQRETSDYLRWIILPDWMERGIFLEPVTDLKNIKGIWLKIYYEVSKNKEGIFEYKKIKPLKGELETSLFIDGKNIPISKRFDKLILTNNFTIAQLLKATPPSPEGLTGKSKCKIRKNFKGTFGIDSELEEEVF